MAEMSYEFVANTVRSSAGTEGMKFFPFVFTLFMFVLFANIIGLIPYSFTVTRRQLIVTATLALAVFFIVVIYGFWRNGLGFLKLFVPKGVPIYILPAIVVIDEHGGLRALRRKALKSRRRVSSDQLIGMNNLQAQPLDRIGEHAVHFLRLAASQVCNFRCVAHDASNALFGIVQDAAGSRENRIDLGL